MAFIFYPPCVFASCEPAFARAPCRSCRPVDKELPAITVAWHNGKFQLLCARCSIAVLDASKDHFVAWRNLAERPEAVVRAASEARQWREEEASHCLAAVAKSRYS